jgi:catechol 2,3-dioxygenase-like lactoylglutathione lyase family enzyme
MGFHHLALAVKDIEATHRFYTEAMGFTLAKVEVVPKNGGIVRHVFYSTGPARDQLIAFWDYSRVALEQPLKTDISQDLGFERGVNHVAFSADDLDDRPQAPPRALARGRPRRARDRPRLGPLDLHDRPRRDRGRVRGADPRLHRGGRGGCARAAARDLAAAERVREADLPPQGRAPRARARVSECPD